MEEQLLLRSEVRETLLHGAAGLSTLLIGGGAAAVAWPAGAWLRGLTGP